ncbi:hypothetical protein [Peribacillus butanolivorans]
MGLLHSYVSKASVSKKLNQPKYVVKRNNKAIENVHHVIPESSHLIE